jgi:hypothetical protein
VRGWPGHNDVHGSVVGFVLLCASEPIVNCERICFWASLWTGSSV